ncbi:sensor histidine kinase [Mesorhizobium sp. M2D.F.Ca.ET.185.01.1.1]|uniref:sensor histidine kinase n=1 Tax=unclassified Mesorhizobium TaxID=325217 RepID=UPI000FC9FA6F|nr:MULTISPECIES: sensor histidine kinase [unclassified Mesorhizobium]TGP57331.1 sensor histidine kinase [bacterium M00.F.Ca.ET.230.01.1.1]TGP77122.1 sensor histidine kinase [bacterium M00.F.Ca.ET.227.01.1.1]TGP84491.1 sensor histidine kinase [bacterium M00.F.Ca.ET.221.01.1.1]TGT70793.1 sensor histidine kinase [bacterium M00.F.Ca.ET.159.01.1.1]TGT82436.1 sensor histidine kinase [bacterium M00.F.Ca.ET.157.01.1.1]TGU03087.1 sensor histidine kinase [bacterium M00.F.Ca.ET.163.01.1.1]TGU30869.1 se
MFGRYFKRLARIWSGLSLAWQFVIAGGIGLLAVMLVVGLWVTSQIRDGVMHNSAATTALYVDSVIAPLLPDMRKSQELDDTVKRALDETLGQGALGKRLVSFKLWRRDGTILYSKNAELIGKQIKPNANLVAAFAGNVMVKYNKLEDEEDDEERSMNAPLLEIYNPVREPWSGEVVAVSEFYELSGDFEESLNSALWWSWLVVAAATATALALLSGIVFRGSRTIAIQQEALEAKVSELQMALAQNSSLRQRVQRASRRATAINERYLRRIGADLHDGPAQLVALAALRMDSPMLVDPATSSTLREAEIAGIHKTLGEAMREIRGICNGLVLPQIETQAVTDILRLAVTEHERRTDTKVLLTLPERLPELGTSEKISIYRFVQEGLNNAYRHGKGKGQQVRATTKGGKLLVEVLDTGPGFDPARSEGLGLAGLRERIESIGGQFETLSGPGGTRLVITLSVEEQP